MNFNADSKALMQALKKVTGVVDSRSTMPIYGNIALSLSKGELTITACDSETQSTVSIPVDEIESGSTTVPADKFNKIVNALKSEVSVSTEKDVLHLKSGRGRFKLSTLPYDDYPLMAADKSTTQFNIEAKLLLKLVSSTIPFTAISDVRFYLNGLLFDFNDGYLTVVATNGHRLALSSDRVETELQDALQIILPRKCALELRKLLLDVDDTVTVSMNQTMINFEISANLTLTSKLIDGRFPEYLNLIQQVNVYEAIIDRQDLIDMCKRVSITSNEKYKGCRFTFAKGLLTGSSRNPDQSESEETLDIELDCENGFEVGLNIDYLIDSLSVMESEKIIWSHSDSVNNSMLVEPLSDDIMKHVIMPMKL